MMVMMLPVVIHNYAPKLTAKTERPKFIFPYADPTPGYPAIRLTPAINLTPQPD
jgi:hypothetical protein